MKSITKFGSVCIIILLMIFMLTACGISKEELIGTWKRNWVDSGNLYATYWTFYPDGTCYRALERNGSPYTPSFSPGLNKEAHDYRITDGKVIVDSLVSNDPYKTFEYEDGKLIDENGYEYNKI